MEHFNQMANTWDTPEKIELNTQYAKEISKHLGDENLKILEVGCGTGLLGYQFVKSDNQLLGIDTSKGMLDIFNEKFKNNKNVKSLLCNLENENITESNFNLVISSMAFHHLVNPGLVLPKIKEVTAKNGYICLIDLESEDGSFHPDPLSMGVHHFGFSKETVEKWGKNSHLSFLEYKIVHTIDKNQKKYPIFLAVFKNEK